MTKSYITLYCIFNFGAYLLLTISEFKFEHLLITNYVYKCYEGKSLLVKILPYKIYHIIL